MRQWIFLLGGLLVWFAHFFAVYIAASLFPGARLAAWLTLALTAVALAFLVLLARSAWRASSRAGNDETRSWMAGVSALGCALAFVAVLYQGVPALLG